MMRRVLGDVSRARASLKEVRSAVTSCWVVDVFPTKSFVPVEGRHPSRAARRTLRPLRYRTKTSFEICKGAKPTMTRLFKLGSGLFWSLAAVLFVLGLAIGGQAVLADEPLVPPVCTACTTVCPKEDNACVNNDECVGCTSCSCQTPPRGGCDCCANGSSCT